jgi:hypothetical protein
LLNNEAQYWPDRVAPDLVRTAEARDRPPTLEKCSKWKACAADVEELAGARGDAPMGG